MYSLNATSFIDPRGQLLFDITFRDGDSILEKRIEVEDFMDMLNSARKDSVSLQEVDIYPPEIRRALKGRDGDFKALMLFPAKMRGISYMGKVFYVPFPTLLMEVSFRNHGRQYANMFALDSDNPTVDSKVYWYPFGNVGDSGSICFGNISVEINGIKDCPKLFDAFINGATNNDLYDRERNKMEYGQGQLLDELSKLDTYPVEWLVEKGDTTYGDFFK